MTCINVGFIAMRVLYQILVYFCAKKYAFSFTSESRLKMGSKLCTILN